MDDRLKSEKRLRSGAEGKKLETRFEPLLKHKQPAELLDVDREMLRRMTVHRDVPAYSVGRFGKHRTSEPDAWLRSHLSCPRLSCREKVDPLTNGE